MEEDENYEYEENEENEENEKNKYREIYIRYPSTEILARSIDNLTEELRYQENRRRSKEIVTKMLAKNLSEEKASKEFGML